MAEWILSNMQNEEILISKSPFQAGRSNDLDIICLSNKVSRNHAHFLVSDQSDPNGTLHVQDNQSSNGTYINGQRIDPYQLRQLHVNDEVGLGLHSRMNAEVFEEGPHDFKYIFTVKKRLTNAVIVLDDPENDDNAAQKDVCDVADSPLTRERLLDILDSDNEVNRNPNLELPSNSRHEESSSTDTRSTIRHDNAVPITPLVNRIETTNPQRKGKIKSPRKEREEARKKQRKDKDDSSTSGSSVNDLEPTTSNSQRKGKVEATKKVIKDAEEPSTSVNHSAKRRTSKLEVKGRIEPSDSVPAVKEFKGNFTHEQDIKESDEQQRKDRNVTSVKHLTKRRTSEPETIERTSNSATSVNHLTRRPKPAIKQKTERSDSTTSGKQFASNSAYEQQLKEREEPKIKDRNESSTSGTSVNHLTRRRTSTAEISERAGPSNSAYAQQNKEREEPKIKNKNESSTSATSVNHLTKRRTSKADIKQRAEPSNSAYEQQNKEREEPKIKDRNESSTSGTSVNHLTKRRTSKAEIRERAEPSNSTYEQQNEEREEPKIKDRNESSISATSVNHLTKRRTSKAEISERAGPSNSAYAQQNKEREEPKVKNKNESSTSATSVNHLTKRRTSKAEIKQRAEPSNSAYEQQNEEREEPKIKDRNESSISATSVNHVTKRPTSKAGIRERAEPSNCTYEQQNKEKEELKIKYKNESSASVTSVNHLTKPEIKERAEPSNTINHLKIKPVFKLLSKPPISAVNHKTNSICEPNEEGVDQTKTEEAEQIIKQELPYNMTSFKSTTDYTVEDGCVVIDSDDDEFPCSQLLNDEPTSNKSDRESVSESIFCAIKKELEELDHPADGKVYACVNLVDSDGEDSQSWLSDDDNEGEKNEEQENGEVVPPPHIEDNLLTKPQRSSKNKYVIPPIIAPHIETAVKNNRSDRVSKTKLPEKRKSTDEENDQAKKIRTTSFYNGNSKADSSWKRKRKEGTKETKERIHELRKRKLKEIAEKNSEEKEAKAAKCKPTTAKVKVSDSRGKFLTENVNMPSTSRAHTSTNGRPRNISVDFKKPVCSKRPPNTCTSNKPTNVVANGNYVQHPKTTPFIPRSVIPVHAGTHTHAPKNYENIEDVLIRVLNWKAQWFLDWKKKGTLPPIHNRPLSRMSQTYSTYKEYYSSVMPSLELELWNYMIKGMNEAENMKFMAKIEHETKMNNYSELDCFTYITKRQSDDSSHIKVEDAVIVQFVFRQNESFVTMPMLGYVTQYSKRVLKDRDFMDANFGKALDIEPHALITFKVLVQAFNRAIDFDKYMHVKIIISLVPTTRIIRSIKYLEYSSLRQHVLKPTFALYNRQHVPQEKLFSRDNLNAAQYQAVMEATSTCLRSEPGVYLIQGPPGTGKSTVIINIIQQILFRELNNSNNNGKQSCILVVAASNTAVDELTTRLITLKPKMEAAERKVIKLVRLGPKNAIHSALQDYTLYEMARRNIIETFMNPERNPPPHLVNLQRKIQAMTHAGAPESQLNAAKAELEKGIKKIMGRMWHESFRKTEEVLLEKATIICTTLSSCVAQRMLAVFGSRSRTINCCIVDEATQSTEPETLIPLMLGIDKMILVGDPKQLPGVTLSKKAKDCAYGQSLFSRIMSQFEGKPNNPIRMLDTQYRMHPTICDFPSRMYYAQKLITAPTLKNRQSKLDLLKPYIVFNYKMDHYNSQEYSNRSEVDCVVKLLDAIVTNIRDSCAYSIGIVTPYNSQKEGIRAMLKKKLVGPNVSIMVNTVDSFQGQEKDIIIMSCVRDHSNNFISDEQRLNVAMTRAKFALYIIGSDNLLKTCESLGKVYDDAKRRGMMQVVSGNTPTTSLSAMIKCSK